jgi:hypothetical protein
VFRATDELRSMQLYTRRADELLEASEDTKQAEQLLTLVEEGLLRLARSAAMSDGDARHALALRDELSGRLLAAAALDAIEIPVGTIGDVLRKATATTAAGLSAISEALGLLVNR